MKKNLLFIIIVIFLFQIKISSVSAMDCAEIQEKINNYNNVKTELEKYDCSNQEDATVVKNCKELSMKKSALISEIYSISENEKKCTSKASETKKIIEENKNECGVVLGDSVENALNYFMAIFYILGPVLVLAFGTLDFTKATISSDKDALKKASNKFFKRILALIFLFLSPALTRIIINLNTSDNYLSGDVYACNYKNYVLKTKTNITYVERDEDDNISKNGKKSNKAVTGDFVSWKQYEGPWAEDKISCGTLHQCGCLVTSVAIQIANSGTAKSQNFTPSTLVKELNANGGFSGSLFTWTGWQKEAPNFKLKNAFLTISGNLNKKAKTLEKYLEQGYYPVVEVKEGSGRTHYVAILSVQGNKITMADPGSSKTILNGESYPYFVSHDHQLAIFYVED